MEDLSKYNPEGSLLRKMQLRMLEMLTAVDKVFRNNNIQYWMGFGTLLGAARHKGFIPWDDDIDLCIMRSDYKKARQALIDELPDQFVFQDSSTDKYAFFNYARIRDTHSKCDYPHFRKLKEQGLWLDIFMFDTVPSSKALKFVDNLYRRTYHETHHFGDVAYSSPLKKWLNKTAGYVLHPISLILFHTTNWIGKISNTQYVGRYGLKVDRVYRTEYIFPLCELEFEGHRFLAPNNWDAHLREEYNDYMQIPPENKREQILDLTKVEIW